MNADYVILGVAFVVLGLALVQGIILLIRATRR